MGVGIGGIVIGVGYVFKKNYLDVKIYVFELEEFLVFSGGFLLFYKI